MMISNEFLATEVLAHGAYLCLRRSGNGDVQKAGANRVSALAERHQLRNEFDPGAEPSRESIAFLRRRGGTKGDLSDDDVLQADWVIHVASRREEPVADFCGEIARLLEPVARVRVLRGVVRPKNYTGAAMNNWAYAHQVVQQPAGAMPNAFLFPLSKTDDWWWNTGTSASLHSKYVTKSYCPAGAGSVGLRYVRRSRCGIPAAAARACPSLVIRPWSSYRGRKYVCRSIQSLRHQSSVLLRGNRNAFGIAPPGCCTTWFAYAQLFIAAPV